MKKYLASLTLGLALLGGCHKTNVAPPPPLVGQVNAFDGNTYRALVTLQASLNSLKGSIEADPTNLGSLKPALNQATADYNIAIAFWKTYHAAVKAGQPGDQQGTQDALNKAQTDVDGLKGQVKK